MVHERLTNTLETALRESENMLTSVNNNLEIFQKYADCVLQHKENRGRDEYYQVVFTEGRHLTTYIRKSDYDLVVGTANYRFFNRLKTSIEENIRIIKRCLLKLNRVDKDGVFALLPQTYRINTPTIMAFCQSDFAREWKEKHEALKLKYPAPFPDKLTHHVIDDIYVRSKGEQEIYKLLIELGLPFVYESPYWTKDGRLYQDLLFTFDNIDGSFDLQRVQELIELCV